MALLKANKPLTSEGPDFQERKKEGVSVQSRGFWENLQGVKKGGGSGHLEPHQILSATLGSLWPQPPSSLSSNQSLLNSGLWEV